MSLDGDKRRLEREWKECPSPTLASYVVDRARSLGLDYRFVMVARACILGERIETALVRANERRKRRTVAPQRLARRVREWFELEGLCNLALINITPWDDKAGQVYTCVTLVRERFIEVHSTGGASVALGSCTVYVGRRGPKIHDAVDYVTVEQFEADVSTLAWWARAMDPDYVAPQPEKRSYHGS